MTPTRTNTPDRQTVNDEGRTVTTITTKRACNGCGDLLGDIITGEMNAAIDGRPLPDVRGECPNCKPVVDLEAAGCKAWRLTPRNIAGIDHEIDRYDTFAKQFTETDDDGHVVTIGLRIGERPNHVVALFGDWIIRRPDGTWAVHTAPEAVQS